MRLSKPLLYLLFSLALPAWATDEITVLGLFTDKAMLRIDGTQRLLKVGQVSPEGVTLIAADSEQAVIEVNGKRRTLTLGSHISSHFSGPRVKRVQIWPDKLGMYSVSGAINGTAIDFLVDTGATTVALNAADAKKLRIDFMREGKKVMGETASGRDWVYLLKLDIVTVGQITLRNVEAIVFDGPHPSRALLGQSFLNRIGMTRQGMMLQLEQK